MSVDGGTHTSGRAHAQREREAREEWLRTGGIVDMTDDERSICRELGFGRGVRADATPLTRREVEELVRYYHAGQREARRRSIDDAKEAIRRFKDDRPLIAAEVKVLRAAVDELAASPSDAEPAPNQLPDA